MLKPPPVRPQTARPLHWARAVFDAVLYGNGLVAGAAAALAASSAHYWRRPLPWSVPALILAATLFVYNLNGARRHRQPLAAGVPPRRRWIVEHRRLLRLIVAASAVALLVLYLASPSLGRLTWFLGHLALLSLAYSWPVLPGRAGRRRRGLRDVPGLKTLLIGYVWAAVTVWLPALCVGLALRTPEVLALFGRRFCFILAVALIFDLRDYSRDRYGGTFTLPGLLGRPAGRALALACALASVALVLPHVTLAGRAVLAAPVLLTGLVIWFADEHRSDYYFAVWADGLLLVQALALWWA